jgi:hypothetical protein
MSHSDQREWDTTRAKLQQLQERYASLSAAPVDAGQEKAREWTLLSLKKLINQFTEDLARLQARAQTTRQP